MPEAYRPGLPVLSDDERLRRNAIQQEWSNPFQNESIDQRPSMASLYEDEPTTEELLAQARGTLDSTADNARLVAGAGEIGRRGITSGPQSAEMHAPEPEYGYGDVARDAVVGASIPASFLPGPIGMAAGAIQGIDALAGGNPLGAGLAALPAMRALRGAKGAATSMGPIAKTGAEIGAKVSYPRAQATAMQMAGDLPAPATPPLPSYKLGPEKSLEDILGSPSIASLRDDIAEGSGSGSVDLTDALNGLGEAPLSSEEIALARAAQRFGRNFRSESTAEPAEEGIGRLLTGSFGENVPASASRQTARAAVELSDADRAMLREGGAAFRGKHADKALDEWVNAGEGVDGPLPLPSKAEYDIKGMPVTEWNKPVFGGATSSVEGTFGKAVSPKDRTPIDLLSKMSDEDYARFAREMGLPPRPSVKPKARRGEGDDAIIWNQP